MPISEPHREIMWNIAENADGRLGGGIQPIIMYLMALAMFIVFGYGLWKRVQAWRKGKPEGERLGDWGKRFTLLLKEIILQRRVIKEPFPGFFHSFIFYSFIILAVTTGIVALDYDLGTTFFRGWVYLFLSLAADLAGAFVIIGILMAFWRRFVSKPTYLPSVLGDTWALTLILILAVTGFLTEGLRIAFHPAGDPWVWVSPVGWLFSGIFTGMSKDGGMIAHRVLWWTHTVFAFIWMATLPYTKFFHLLALPTNVFFSKLEPRGHLKRDDLEAMMEDPDFDEDNFGVGLATTSSLTWKDRLSFDACIECGRCEQNCPAVMAGTNLNPRLLIKKLKELVESDDLKMKAVKGVGADAAPEPSPIVDTVFDEEFIQNCRTCMACVEVCPAMIDHVDTIMALRQNDVIMEGRVNPEAARSLKQMESLGNPFGNPDDRSDFIKQLGVKVVGPGEEVDVLYWIGCLTTYDPTKQKIAMDLCKLLEKCGVDFGVLGDEEVCCGDPARVMGQEYTFQMTVKTEVESLNSRKFKTLLVSCPHCFNALAHEYPQFGGNYNVVHHSQYLNMLIKEGKIKPSKSLKGKVVFHDPCYLGRYQGIYEEPRQVIASIPGLDLAEMESNHAKSLCCGGGGGHFWMDIKSDERINNLRVQQAKDKSADKIVIGCPYCHQMLDDSVKMLNLDEEMKVVDIASVLLESMEE